MVSSLFFEGTAWSPLVFLLLTVLLLFLLSIFARFWNVSRNAGKQAEPFISGNTELDSMHVTAPNVYWGLFKSFQGFYDKMRAMHSNSVGDYFLWFVIMLALLLVVTGVS